MTTPATDPREVALALVRTLHHDYDLAAETVLDYAEGPFRPLDHSTATLRALAAVTPANRDAVLEELYR